MQDLGIHTLPRVRTSCKAEDNDKHRKTPWMSPSNYVDAPLPGSAGAEAGWPGLRQTPGKLGLAGLFRTLTAATGSGRRRARPPGVHQDLAAAGDGFDSHARSGD